MVVMSFRAWPCRDDLLGGPSPVGPQKNKAFQDPASELRVLNARYPTHLFLTMGPEQGGTLLQLSNLTGPVPPESSGSECAVPACWGRDTGSPSQIKQSTKK